MTVRSRLSHSTTIPKKREMILLGSSAAVVEQLEVWGEIGSLYLSRKGYHWTPWEKFLLLTARQRRGGCMEEVRFNSRGGSMSRGRTGATNTIPSTFSRGSKIERDRSAGEGVW